ncbi:hypothetical protein [Streptosporangium sp. NPDC000396]|uniref:hypothetical protein n=1 Tax=Streptosporangium sp. NPDC000396 TaxID=3366185 RepID=UPI0036CB0A28
MDQREVLADDAEFGVEAGDATVAGPDGHMTVMIEANPPSAADNPADGSAYEAAGPARNS